MIVDFRGDRGPGPDPGAVYELVDPETGEPIGEPFFYADDEAGVYESYLVKPGCEGLSYAVHYLWHRLTHEPLDRRLCAGDPDEHDYEVAWAEVRRPIRIVRRDAAGIGAA